MISIEAHRAAIGRFSGRARKTNNKNIHNNGKWVNMALLLFFMMFLPVILYGLFVMTTYVFSDFLLFFVPFLLTYGNLILIIGLCSDLVAIKVEKINRSVLMRKPSLPKGIEVRTLIPCCYLDTFVQIDCRCKYLDTFVLDGRGWNTQVHDLQPIYSNLQQILHISLWLYMSYTLLMISTKSFLLPVTYTVFMISTKLTKMNNPFKLALLILCYCVNVTNIETPNKRK